MKTLTRFFLVLVTLSNFALADWELWDSNHFKERLGNTNPEVFVATEVNKLISNHGETFTMRVIQQDDAVILAYVSLANDKKGVENQALIQASYLPHIWIKRDLNGQLMEFGSSFMLSRDPILNPRVIEQEVLYFTGKNAKKAFIANW